jgi:hypothetical protein
VSGWGDEAATTGHGLRVLLLEPDASRATAVQRRLAATDATVHTEGSLEATLVLIRATAAADRYPAVVTSLELPGVSWEATVQALGEADAGAVVVGLTDQRGVELLGTAAAERHGVLVLPYPDEGDGNGTWGALVASVLGAEVARLGKEGARTEARLKLLTRLVRAQGPVLETAIQAAATPAPAPLPASGLGRLLARYADDPNGPKLIAGAATAVGGGLATLAAALTAWWQASGG